MSIVGAFIVVGGFVLLLFDTMKPVYNDHLGALGHLDELQTAEKYPIRWSL